MIEVKEGDDNEKPSEPASNEGLANNWQKISEVIEINDLDFDDFEDLDDDVAVCGELTEEDIFLTNV